MRRAVFILLIAAAIYAGATLWTGRTAWTLALTALSSYDVLTIVGLVCVGVLLRAGRWHYYICALHWKVPAIQSLSAFLASIALTATPGKAGELSKAILLRGRHNVSLAQGAGVLLIERLGDVVAVIILAIGGATAFVDLWTYVWVTIAVAVAGTLLAAHPRIAHELTSRTAAFPMLRPLAVRLTNMLGAVQALLRPLPLVIGVSLAISAWGCEALAFHFLVNRLGINSSAPISFSIFGLSTLAGALSMLPGGLGSFEFVMTFLLTRLSAPLDVAAVIVVIFRVCTLWTFSLIGLIFMLGWTVIFSEPRQNSLSRARIMNKVPETSAFGSATVILPVVNETYSLVETVESILRSSKADLREFLIVICDRTTPESMAAIQSLVAKLGDLVVVHRQKLKYLGGAMREAFELARGSHTILMASDLETDPALVPLLIGQARMHPAAVVTVTRWHAKGGFEGYSPVKWIANFVFQKIFSTLFWTKLSDLTYAYRIFPTRLLQAIRWEELRHPLLFETLIKPLRLGVQLIEIPGIWRARTEGESQNTFARNFEYFRIGIRVRLAAAQDILR